ncbi:MAG TPA: FAD-dependent oxidoreductase [Spirochaetota bacterium]|nr:FAD-dependent oxidoreductase [Spirochaetota bacterium]HPV97244.1 FAD-dependent oxidoreductase [Spirochaetota bacterium]
MFPHLFSPITINRLEIKNRIAYPSLGLLYSYDGKLNDRYYAYFREKALGGAGMVTVGPVGIDMAGSGIVVLSLAGDEAIEPFRKLAASIKEAGASAWVQLFHAGAYAFSMALEGERPVAPSEVYSRYSKETPKALTVEEIHALQRRFVDAALRAKEAGFDGVEVIASAGYLITQFLSPLKNLRTDEYGGSFENRVRFPREVIEKIRAAVGPDYPLCVRMAGNDFVPGSNTDLETPKFAKMYEKAGADLISVTGGWHETRVPQLPMELPRGGFSYLALNIKKEVSVPVIASNRIPRPELAERMIRDGACDMVYLGRVLLADPYWPEKAREGRQDEIRPCVACNQGCTDTIFSARPVFCVVNPRAGYEGERNVVKTERPLRVMVAGAGPGGLEAAVTAASAGHSVELYEKGDEIGGQLWIAGAPPHKEELWEIVRYYKAMLARLSIPVYLNTEVSVDLIREKRPDRVIVAEGAEPLMPPIAGLDDPRVLSSWRVLAENPALGKSIAVIGGGAVGLETALFLAAKGTLSPDMVYFLMAHEAESPERIRELMSRGSKEVTVFEMLPRIGRDIGKSTRWVVKSALNRYGVEALTGARVLSVEGGTVVYEANGKRHSRNFDNVVVASGSRPVKRLCETLEKEGIAFTAVGDCVRPAKINDAIHEGFLAALALG